MTTISEDIIDYVPKQGSCTEAEILDHFIMPMSVKYDIIRNAIWLLCDSGKLRQIPRQHCRTYELTSEKPS